MYIQYRHTIWFSIWHITFNSTTVSILEAIYISRNEAFWNRIWGRNRGLDITEQLIEAPLRMAEVLGQQ